MPRRDDDTGNVGCIVIAVVPILLGLALIAAGVFFGDHQGYDWRTGTRVPARMALYIVGGVFTAIGAAFSFILIAGRDKS
ncbi:MAG: hypothetical protein AAF928_16280 [Myxococcota bacterium]